jgi:hypothetical protein
VPKISDEPLQNIQATLFKSDLDYLRSLFKGHVGVNKVIRTVVRTYVNQVKAEAAKRIDKAESQEALL